VTVIPFNSTGQVWLGKRLDNGLWNIVGGYYELGDSAESCARREVREEIGLEIKELTMFGVLTDPSVVRFTYPNGDEVQSPSHVFVAVLEDGEVLADDEHSDFMWASLEEARALVSRTTMGYSSTAFEMYANWLQTKQFQIK
ncbi:MAG: hypothetical protein DI585_07150, partial [Pseudomonas fluorescens]